MNDLYRLLSDARPIGIMIPDQAPPVLRDPERAARHAAECDRWRNVGGVMRAVGNCDACARAVCVRTGNVRHEYQHRAKPRLPVARTPDEDEYLVINGTTRRAGCQWCAEATEDQPGQLGCGAGYLGECTYSRKGKHVRRVLCGHRGGFRWAQI